MTFFLAAVLLAQNLFSGLPINGVRCDADEGAVIHVHAHLQIFDRGRAVAVPANVGIPPGVGCLYWLHTHSDDGIIHVESPEARTFTLGQFFDIWDMDLNRQTAAGVHAARGKTLRVTVNGVAFHGNPRTIPLRDREEIVIQDGPPYAHAVAADWSRL